MASDLTPDSDMIFALDIDDPPSYDRMSSLHWDPYSDWDKFSPYSSLETSPQFSLSPLDSSSPPDGSIYGSPTLLLSNWLNDDLSSSPPVSIPSPPDHSDTSFVSYGDRFHFPQDGSYSPAAFAALHPLPASPSTSFDDSSFAVAPQDISSRTPAWAANLWDDPLPARTRTSSRPSPRHSPLSDATQRLRIPARADPRPAFPVFQSSSAPSVVHAHTPSHSRFFSQHHAPDPAADPTEDRDATVRRRKRSSLQDEPRPADRASETPPLKSMLRPPKLAPSAWQLYFTDWIQRQQATSSRKLNVAQAAKEAGQEYATLTAEEKEPYKRRSQAAKEMRERELAAYMRTLTPEDIKRENTFRAAQRKAGKSRKSNIRDPNAPRKPLSAYFMFLQRIRADAEMVAEVFGDETETTKQSVLAAARWRAMTDDERKPFLARAEQEKLDYEAARRLYEDGTAAFPTNINFSILPGSPAETAFRASRPVKMESESEGEDFTIDDGFDQFIRS